MYSQEEKSALQDRVSAASTDRADAQRALIGASEEVSVLTTEHKRAVAETQRLCAENEALRRERRMVQELERELKRARAGSRDVRVRKASLCDQFYKIEVEFCSRPDKLDVTPCSLHARTRTWRTTYYHQYVNVASTEIDMQ